MMPINLNALRIENDVLIGSGDELYLAGGNHGVVRFATGETVIRADSIVNMRDNLAIRREAAARMGFAFAHMIAPEKYRVVPQHFPLKQTSGLAQQYANGGCEGMIDPVRELRAETEGCTYYRTDTHWAPHGKIVAARLLALASGRAPAEVAAVEAATRAALVRAPEYFCGDLGRKLDPKQAEPTFTFKIPHRVQTFENGLPHDYVRPVNDGRMVLTESDADTARGTLLIFGDSYLHQTLPVLSFFFRRVLFCRTRWFHEELVGMVRPDIVVTQQAERYLSYVFPDSGAPPFLLMAQMLGRTPAPSQPEALALARALSGGRELDLRPFARLLGAAADAPAAAPAPPILVPAPAATMRAPTDPAQVASSRRVALLGDSRVGISTRVSGAQVNHSSFGFPVWADALLGGALRFEHADNFGVSNATAPRLLDQVPAILAAERYWACIYSAGTNDAKPEHGSLSAEATMAAMRQTWDRLRMAGLRLFIVQDLPRTADAWRRFGIEGASLAALQARAATIRAFTTDYAARHEDVHVIDALSLILDEVSNEPRPLALNDGTNPSPWGAWKVGAALAEAIRPHLPPGGSPLAAADDPFDAVRTPAGTLLQNGRMQGQSAEAATVAVAGRPPLGWQAVLGGTLLGGSLDLSAEAGCHGQGNAAIVTARGGNVDRAHAVVGIRTRLRLPPASAGRRLQATVVVGVDAAPAGLRGVTCRLVLFDAAGALPRTGNAFEEGPAHFWPGETDHRLVLRTPAMEAPEGAAGIAEILLLVTFDGAHPGGASFRVSFERASLRVID